MRTTKTISQMTGVAFVVVDAKDESTKRFYEKYGFKSLSANPMHLAYPVKNL